MDLKRIKGKRYEFIASPTFKEHIGEWVTDHVWGYEKCVPLCGARFNYERHGRSVSDWKVCETCKRIYNRRSNKEAHND